MYSYRIGKFLVKQAMDSRLSLLLDAGMGGTIGLGIGALSNYLSEGPRDRLLRDMLESGAIGAVSFPALSLLRGGVRKAVHAIDDYLIKEKDK
jgi:hypothetical protein